MKTRLINRNPSGLSAIKPVLNTFPPFRYSLKPPLCQFSGSEIRKPRLGSKTRFLRASTSTLQCGKVSASRVAPDKRPDLLDKLLGGLRIGGQRHVAIWLALPFHRREERPICLGTSWYHVIQFPLAHQRGRAQRALEEIRCRETEGGWVRRVEQHDATEGRRSICPVQIACRHEGSEEGTLRETYQNIHLRRRECGTGWCVAREPAKKPRA